MNAITSIVIAVLQLSVIILGKEAMANFIAQVRMAWLAFKDQEFVAMCDAKYNSMLEGWDKYKSDREE